MRALGNAAQREWATNELDGHARSDALDATAVFDMAGVQGAIRFSQLGAVTTVRVATCASVCAGAFLERRCQRNSLKVSVVRMAAGAPAGRSVGNPTAGVRNTFQCAFRSQSICGGSKASPASIMCTRTWWTPGILGLPARTRLPPPLPLPATSTHTRAHIHPHKPAL
jgi:hypothetical protein